MGRLTDKDGRVAMPMPPADGNTLSEWLARVERRVDVLEQWRRDREIRQAVPSKPPAEPAPARPLQVGDRVRNAAGTDTGVVKHFLANGDAKVYWDSGANLFCSYNPCNGKLWNGDYYPDYGHVVLIEPDFDTQAREAGYVKAEEVAGKLMNFWAASTVGTELARLLARYHDELRGQAKGGAK